MAMTNSTGGGTGSQKIGGITVNTGKISVTKNKKEQPTSSASHAGDFHGDDLLSIASISGKYNDRFDDTGYYV